MFIRNKHLMEVGLFDENFFMYFEDVDLSRRLNAVSETLYTPDFKITHRYGKGSYKSTRLLLIHVRSALYYFTKWGWLFDSDRARVNRRTLAQFKG